MIVSEMVISLFIINIMSDIHYIYTNANFLQEQFLPKETCKEQTQKVSLLQEGW
jgi:hypothetical protein